MAFDYRRRNLDDYLSDKAGLHFANRGVAVELSALALFIFGYFTAVKICKVAIGNFAQIGNIAVSGANRLIVWRLLFALLEFDVDFAFEPDISA